MPRVFVQQYFLIM